MDFFGAIDRVYLLEDRFFVSGWSYVLEKGNRAHVERMSTDKDEALSVKNFPRLDIDEDNQFGFEINIEDKDVIAIILGSKKILAHYKSSSAEVAIWSEALPDFWSVFMRKVMKRIPSERHMDILAICVGLLRKEQFDVIEDKVNLQVEFGFQNYDRSVCVGREGFLFLTGGSNKVSDLYKITADVEPVVDRWIALIRKRMDDLSRLNIGFLQLIVPEKQSMMGHLSPQPTEGPTAILGNLSHLLIDSPNYVDALSILHESNLPSRSKPFRKVDTHLTLAGCFSLIQDIYRRIDGHQPNIEWPRTKQICMTGDLGVKFGIGNIVEMVDYPDSDWPLSSVQPKITSSHDPEEGLTGTMRQWLCPEALSPKRVIVFGNSMLERGGDALGISWWMARLFKEFTFVWSASIDHALIAEKKPDYVLCQTVERFLLNVPDQ